MTDSGWADSTGLPPAESDGCGAEVDSPEGGRLSKPATRFHRPGELDGGDAATAAALA